ncbi:MAG TPA: aldehyde dehydrogenase, partial [Planctomycetes bacterium]|nr:aldehyde dehydrogenase [Planctomycetota bacterium]
MTQVVINPHDGSTVCEHPYMDERRDELLDGLVAAQRAWREVPLAERVERIGAALAGFSEHAEAIARDVTLQVGKPISQSRGEVQGCVARAEHVLSLAPTALATDVLEDLPGRGEGVIERRIRHEPLGVIANLAAWNYPLLIPVNVVIPALAAGNAVLLKHSERTPLVGEWFERIFAPLEGALRQVVLTHDHTAAWLGDARIDGVGFTGSVRGGLAVQRAARERFVPVGLELGGKDPAYVAEDADLEFSAPNVVEGACYNAGQSCCAIERVYVHRSRYEEFLERAEAALAGWAHGDPLDEATTLGPQATERAPELLETHVRDALESGAKLVAG